MDLNRDFHTHNRQAPWPATVNIPAGEVDGYLAAHPGATVSVGLHPWDTVRCEDGIATPLTAAELDAAMEQVERAAAMEGVVAIGETGLDRHRGASLQEQEEVLRRHIALSERLAKPLILHIVGCWDTLLKLKKELRPRQRWTVHGYRGGLPLARQLTRAGIALSLGMRHNRAVAAGIDPAMLNIETDDDAVTLAQVARGVTASLHNPQ